MAIVALAATPGTAAAVRDLVALVGRGHRIVSWHHHRRTTGPQPDAIVAADVGVLRDLGRSGPVVEVPVACRVTSLDDLYEATAWGVTVAVASEPALRSLDPSGPDVALVWAPAPGLDIGSVPVLPLLTRHRLRQALGLPDSLVLAVDATAPRADRATSLALASAAVVDEPLVPLALALGTPAVVSAAVADRLGLEPNVHVVVATDDAAGQADRLAAALARDEERAAALARNARRFAEDHLDVTGAATRIRRHLGLEPSPSLIGLRLDELATPADSRLRARADEALTLFTLEPTP